jgi:glutamate dehydrogenase
MTDASADSEPDEAPNSASATDAAASAATVVEDGLPAFTEQYWERVPPEDASAHTAEEREDAARAHLTLAAVRHPGEDLVRVSRPGEGAGTTRGLVEVVTDDSGFLVDSVRLAIGRVGLGVDLVVHPIVRVLRDEDDHSMLGVLRPRDPGAEAIPESFIRVELESEAETHRFDGLEDEVRKALGDVRVVNEDWAAMHDATRQLAQRLDDEEQPPVDDEDRSQTSALLRWLIEDHFVFLGYREYELGKDDDGGEALLAVPDSGLGLLRDERTPDRSKLSRSFRALPESVRRLALAPDLLLVTKANSRSTVFRPSRIDYLGVKRFDSEGNVVGERRLLGLFTSAAYRSRPADIPLLRRKVAVVRERAGFPRDSHDDNALVDVMDSLPRTELFQATVDELGDMALGVLSLQERRRVRVLTRPDAFGRYVSCLVYLPRDRFTTQVRQAVQKLVRTAFDGVAVDYETSLSESTLARLHVVVHLDEPTEPDELRSVDVAELEQKVAAASRSWDDDLVAALLDSFDEKRASELARRYRGAFAPGYRDDVPADRAVTDIERFEALDPDGDLKVVLRRPVNGELRLRVYRAGQGLALSDVLPLLHDTGVKVLEARPHEVRRSDTSPVWVHDLHLSVPGDGGELPTNVATAFEEVVTRSWQGEVDSDGFSRLVLAAQLSAREVALLRAYGRYLRQTASTYSQDYQEDVLAAHPDVARSLVELFCARTDPARRSSDDDIAETEKDAERISSEIWEALDEVESLDEDRILRSFLGLVTATLRTNWWQRDDDGDPPPAVVLKLDSPSITDLPQPRPHVEIWVHSPRVEGVHLRGGKVARGGLRWSDRREDFRTEVLGLMKAQMTKNAVIVPVGAKGGFVVKRPPEDRNEIRDEAEACYRIFIGGLLSVTDNLVDGEVVHPDDVVRADDDDPYLVVAADKGTATLSDTANEIAAEYGFWLDDAFASGGSRGYDHKAMGITARGAWVSVRRHGLELGIDVQNEDFTVVGVGDMSGDVFGNGMLLSRHIRLVAAFDHRHIFLDPDPDAESSFAERERLFGLDRSTWEQYDTDLISEGGGVHPRSAKSIKLTPQVREALGLTSEDPEEMTPPQLIRAILRAPVDLLWNGGIGTYVKASTETHDDVGDKASDSVRIDGRDLRARMIGEGGNLGLTQLGRIEYAGKGGLVNTDAIDNSAGVDCSDHEVNIKILMRSAMDEGELDPDDRDELLESMTEEVAEHCLRDNDGQTRALSNARAQAASMVDVHRRYLRVLEAAGVVDRELEALPGDEELIERAAESTGLLGPEFAVMLAYTKTQLYAQLLDSDVPEDPWLGRELVRYFPSPLRDRFSDTMQRHRLRREIIATALANELVNRAGITFAFRLGEETGAPAPAITRASTVAREVFRLRDLWHEVESLDGKIDADVQVAIFLRIRTLLERTTRWLLRTRDPIDIEATVERFAAIEEVAEALPDLLGELASDEASEAEQQDRAAGVPDELARRLSILPALVGALDVVEVAAEAEESALDAAGVYYGLGDRLRLDWLRVQVVRLPRADRWQTLARAALRDDYYSVRRALTAEALRMGGVAEWDSANRPGVDRFLRLLNDIEARGSSDLATLSVALREARGLCEASG